ncbi:hypothetical protein GCM10027610_032440 [Dactylosporangium cerinum]
MMRVSHAAHPEDLDLRDATPAAGSAGADLSFAPADLTAFCRLDELGLEVTGQRLEPGRAVLACRVVPVDGSDERRCRDCGCEGGRPQVWRDGVEVVAMDGFTGFKTATTEELPDAVAVMDPFHVVRLAGDALDRCRRRVQNDIHGQRGRKNDPLCRARQTLHTGADLLTDKQSARLRALFVEEQHVEVEATWGVYQAMIAAYREPNRARGKMRMQTLIHSISHGVPAALREVIILGRTLKKRAVDVLAYFDRPGTSNGPTEALNGRLEHLRGSALGFRNRVVILHAGERSMCHAPLSCRHARGQHPCRSSPAGQRWFAGSRRSSLLDMPRW